MSLDRPSKIKILRIICWSITAAIMIFIFFHSAKNATQSSAQSDPIAKVVYSIVVPDDTAITVEQKADIMNSIQLLVRKSAHFLIFAALGFSFFASLTTHFVGTKKKFILSQIFSSAYAATDEFHQLFVEGRAGRLSDVLLDSAGAIFGISLCFAIIFLITKIKKGRAI